MQTPRPAHPPRRRCRKCSELVGAFLLAHVAAGTAGCADDSVPSDADFALVATTGSIDLRRGTLVTIDFSLERRGNFASNVTVTASMLVAGVTPGAATLRDGDTAGELQLAVESSAPLGPVRGAILIGVSESTESSEPLERTTPLVLVVTEVSP